MTCISGAPLSLANANQLLGLLKKKCHEFHGVNRFRKCWCDICCVCVHPSQTFCCFSIAWCSVYFDWVFRRTSEVSRGVQGLCLCYCEVTIRLWCLICYCQQLLPACMLIQAEWNEFVLVFFIESLLIDNCAARLAQLHRCWLSYFWGGAHAVWRCRVAKLPADSSMVQALEAARRFDTFKSSYTKRDLKPTWSTVQT